MVTTGSLVRIQSGSLWFAFNLSSFYFWLQLTLFSWRRLLCCDLLSILVLSIFGYNNIIYYANAGWLWFAFNLSSFYFWLQHQIRQWVSLQSCDLLSILVLSIFGYNKQECTTDSPVLWFAFNLSSFYFWLQQALLNKEASDGCDLLSILVLSIFGYNKLDFGVNAGLVVICFQS